MLESPNRTQLTSLNRLLALKIEEHVHVPILNDIQQDVSYWSCGSSTNEMQPVKTIIDMNI